MNKTEFVAAIAEKSGLTKVAAAGVVDNVLEVITATLIEGDKLTIPGFGTFSTGQRAARTGKNPRTGEPLKIAASTTVKFSAGATLKEAVQPKKPAKGKK